MSFFNDFLNYFDISDIKKDITISMIVDIGLIISGKFKLKNFSTEEINVIAKKKQINVFGNNLIISAMGSGEIVITGNVTKIDIGDDNGK